ncbi:diguanylate cyclase [Tropicimonas sp.]|uniref:diguanylate cyclase n=1 Tax=Tropicimonas sp. TaxID=2067044 RepID=UPI003A8A44C9
MPGRILLVDDIAANRTVLAQKLSGAFYDVLHAENGDKALNLARCDRPDIVLVDGKTAESGGFGICRRLRADPRTSEIPIVILARQNDTEAKLSALTAGADEFLSAPLDDMVLLARIRSLLRARDIAAELALREGTSQALGFAEPAADFSPAGRICLIAQDMERARQWRERLRSRIRDRIEIRDRAGALSPGTAVPDLFILTSEPGDARSGLLLLSELRSRPETRHAGIIVTVAPDDQPSAAMALDLGASDLVTLPLGFDELALRLKAMMRRKRQGDRLRDRLRDGLQMAVTDPLTGLYNRRYAMSHLKRVRDRALVSERSFAVMLVDLDHFKTVNDSYGHGVGDAILQAVAKRISMNLRSVDLVARFGGEEFLIVLPDVDLRGAQRVAERLRREVGTSTILLPATARRGALPVTQTISIGLALGSGSPPNGGDELSEILDRADRALYQSKERGRNRVTLDGAVRAAA